MNRRITAILIAAIIMIPLTACSNKHQDITQVSQAFEVPPTAVPGTTANIFTEDTFVETTPTPVAVEETTQPTDYHSESTNTLDTKDTESTSSPVELPENTTSTNVPSATAYERYNAMSADEQLAYYNSFDSVEAFFAWYNAAQDEYIAAQNTIEVDGSVIDIDQIIGGQS